MNGGGDTPTLKTRFKLRPAANGAPGSVLCDNYGRLLDFSTGEQKFGCIVVNNGVATLVDDLFAGDYKASFDTYGYVIVSPVIADATYTFNLDTVFDFATESLTVTIGQPLTEVGNFVAVPADCYWRPAGDNKVLCDRNGKMLVMTWGEEYTRQEIIDDEADVGVVFWRASDDTIRAANTWDETPFYSLRSQLLTDYDFEIIEASDQSSNFYQILLSNGALLYYYAPSGGAVYQTPDSFPDYVAP